MTTPTPSDTHSLLQAVIRTYLGTMDHSMDSLLNKIEENGQDIWSTACQHKLQMVLHDVLKSHDEVSSLPLLVQLKNYRLKHLQRSLLKLNELQKVVTAFEAENIVVTPYKGLAFAHCFYQDISMRSSVDIDLAISLLDIPASFAIMKSLGYVEKSKEKNGASSHEKALHKSRAYHIDYSWLLYEDKKVKVNVELHWQPSHPVLYLPLEFADLPSSARTNLQISGKKIVTFTKPYLALFTLIHHGLIDCWGQYRHLLDLGMMLKNMTEEEYAEFKALLEMYQLLQTYYTGLYLLETLFDYPISDKNYKSKKHQKLGQKLIKELQTNQLVGKWSDNPCKLLYHFSMRDNLYQQIKTGKNLLLFKMKF